MGGTSWTLHLTLPGPDVGAVERLTALFEVLTGAGGITAGPTTLSVGYPDEASAREVMRRVLSERPDVRCSVESTPPGGGEPRRAGDEEGAASPRRVACPTCEGTGRTGPTDGRPCVVCAGSGLVRADVAEEIARSEGLTFRPTGAG